MDCTGGLCWGWTAQAGAQLGIAQGLCCAAGSTAAGEGAAAGAAHGMAMAGVWWTAQGLAAGYAGVGWLFGDCVHRGCAEAGGGGCIGGPKLRKWYGAADLLPKDGSILEEDDESPVEDEVRDAVLVTDGDNEIGQARYATHGSSLISCYMYFVANRNGNIIANCQTNSSQSIGFLSQVESLKGVQNVILLSQLSVYKGTVGIQALMNSKARKLAEQDESIVMASGIPYTIIRAGSLQNTPGGKQGFSFKEEQHITGKS
ncbi:NAD(P)-binding Rossmann-fold superfamily protein [Actinidia rufa]|uniref:NAD(P)-binding Rossmann-fold superfamily protein n=1 Tax=Actinidia rufa TaxID=165716 RepID=A0A7J0FER3_9ERIC|nr:NAD(P)-binding Rossmann-fold superfamily protein [Actinidia rufa]